MKKTGKILALMTASALAMSMSAGLAAQQVKGKILVILPSASVLPLKHGKTFKTGYYLNELTVPAQKFVSAGYVFTFANPKGNTPPVAEDSLNAMYFGGSKKKLEEAEKYQRNLKGFAHPLTLKEVAQSDLSQYSAVFVPGGPAPMIDLMKNRDLGSILRYFHQHKKTTVLLCHAPIALLSAENDPDAVQQALRTGNLGEVARLSAGWTYKNYKLTVFSDEEEGIAAKNVFLGSPEFTPQASLEAAGAEVKTVKAWHPEVVEDRELITGQNPFSDSAMMEVVLKKLKAQH